MTWLAARDRAAAQPLPAGRPNPLMDVHYLGWNEGRLTGVREPYGPDRTVFGDWGPSGPVPDVPRVWRNCREHEVGWSGDGGCWAPGHGRASSG